MRIPTPGLRTWLLASGILALAVVGLGCYTQNAPYAVVGGYAIGGPPPPRPVPQNIPPGVEHDACRVEMSKALDRIEYLEAALKSCEQDRDKYEKERDALEDKVDDLEDRLDD